MFQLCACHSDIPQYNSSETFRNVPLLLSHVCLCAVRFDGYGKTNPKLDTVAHFSRSLGISIDALVGIVPKGDVPSCVRTFFAGMSAEEAAKYIRLCKDADELTKK